MDKSNRQALAYDLANTIATGPSGMRAEDLALYRLWMSTWVLPKLVALQPELDGLNYRAATSREQPFFLPMERGSMVRVTTNADTKETKDGFLVSKNADGSWLVQYHDHMQSNIDRRWIEVL
jgi:hypothetical protein